LIPVEIINHYYNSGAIAMPTCLWKHESVGIPEVQAIFDIKPEVIKTSTGYWSKSDQYIIPIRELEDMIRWDSYNCGPIMDSILVTHVIWDNGDIILYSSDEGYVDGNLTELQKFASIEEADKFVAESGF
jgi:hypothetical protein